MQDDFRILLTVEQNSLPADQHTFFWSGKSDYEAKTWRKKNSSRFTQYGKPHRAGTDWISSQPTFTVNTAHLNPIKLEFPSDGKEKRFLACYTVQIETLLLRRLGRTTQGVGGIV